MGEKKTRYQSLSDASDLLKNFGRALADRSPKPTQATPAPSNEKPETIEEALLRKTQSAAPSPSIPGGRAAPVVRAAPGPKIRPGKAKRRQKKDGKAQKTGARRPEELLVTAEAREAYRRQVEAQQQAWLASQAAQAPKPIKFTDPRIKRADLFERIREAAARFTPHVEARPSTIEATTAAQIDEAVERGSRSYAEAPLPDDDGFIVGFDFGTSSLKLAVRQPYRAGNWLEFRTAPSELRSGGHCYLWQTALWFDPETQRFSLYPIDGWVVLEGFKTGIVAGDGGKRVLADQAVTRVEAAIAFMTLQLAHFFGWYHRERPLGDTASDKYLSINVGIPIASLDDERSFRDFRRILVVASELLPFASELDLSIVRQTYQQSGDVLPAGWDLVPELTAAVAGYAAEPTSQAGSHILIDVGASTLDIVAFNHVRGERIAVISAAVELLGAACLETTRQAGIPDSDFKAACDYQFEEVYGEARQYSRGGNGFSPTLRQNDVQLVTTGGGCASPLHAQFIAEMNVEGVLGASPLVRPEPPAASVAQDCDRSRLLLAYGLTRDLPERPELKPPSQVPSIKPPSPRPDTFISKDML